MTVVEARRAVRDAKPLFAAVGEAAMVVVAFGVAVFIRYMDRITW
jgi:hypothetical protein